jgi:hypothetical protein
MAKQKVDGVSWQPRVENRPDLVRIYSFSGLWRYTAVATPWNPNPSHQGGLLPFFSPFRPL